MRKLKRTKTKLRLVEVEKLKNVNSLDNKKLYRKKLSLQVRRLKALEMRKAGKSYQYIADKLGTNLSSVYTDVGAILRKEITKRTKSQLSQIVQLELGRLDLLFEKAWNEVKNNNMTAVDKALKIMERRARYLGLDSPAKSLVGEDPEKPFRGDRAKLKVILTGMIKNKQKMEESKEKEVQMDNRNVVNS